MSSCRPRHTGAYRDKSLTQGAVLLAVLIMCALQSALSYSNGAPLTSCKEMVPRHNKGPTFTHHNFQLVVDTGILEGRVTIRLLTLNQSVKFRGFFIRAMSLKGNNWVFFPGIFEKDAKFQDSLYVNCDGHEKSAVSHGDSKDKVEVVVHWRPEPRPKDLVQAIFRATVVQTYDIFFVKLESRTLLFGAADPAMFRQTALVDLHSYCITSAAVWLFYAWAV
ncbi:putative defense protein isoform X1 [Dermacentor albipictus]|uniref:putative defense protein isoform X1 n=1 Tax=Dermacentor albipictus TaxID=60249 RepID=UPI0031FD01C7